DLAIEARDAFHGAGAHVEADIGHAELDPAEALDVRRVHGDAVAPRAHRLDAVVALAEFEFGAVERLLYPCQPGQQRIAVRHDQPGDAAQHFGLAHRQVKLTHADIDPHIA